MNEFFTFKLDFDSGVPLYRQLIDQVFIALALEALVPGDRLPTVTTVSNALSINSNTVIRAYKELALRGILITQQGAGTFIAPRKLETDAVQRRRRLRQIVSDFVARTSGYGYSLEEVINGLQALRFSGWCGMNRATRVHQKGPCEDKAPSRGDLE